MEALITAAQFVLALSILITLHECGHFWAARAFGIRIEKFYLFFDAWGFKLFSFKKGDTEYGIGWLPLGGYVKIAGMVDESLDKDQLKAEPQAWEYRSKPAWQRLIVITGGVIVNLILGILIMVISTFIQGEKYIPNDKLSELGGVYAGPVARKLGFQTGDKIISLNGKPVDNLQSEFGDPSFLLADKKEVIIDRNGDRKTLQLPNNLEEQLATLTDIEKEYPIFAPRVGFSIETVLGGSNASKAGLKAGDRIIKLDTVSVQSFFEFRELLRSYAGKKMVLSVVRINDETTVSDAQAASNQPKVMDTVLLNAEATTEGTLGFMPKDLELKQLVKTVHYSVLESITLGTQRSFSLIGGTAKSLGKVASGQVDASKSLAGPVGIAQMFGGTWDWGRFWSLTAILSLTLAFMNILPIPALDGGHMMFILWEMITGKPVTEKVLYVGQIIGMIVLLSLMAFVFWVDIARLLSL
jgi:regulator of sigma E protease